MNRIKSVALAAIVLCVLAGALHADTSSAATCTTRWLAPVSGFWFDGTKWSGGTVPTAADDVCIDVDGTYTVSVSGQTAAVARSLVLGAPSGTQTLKLSGGACPSQPTLGSGLGAAMLSVGLRATVASNGAVELTSWQPSGLTPTAGCSKSATLEVAGLWNEGTITASIGAGGDRVLHGNVRNLGRVVVNQTLTLDRSGDRWDNNARLEIGPSARLLLAGGQTFANSWGGSIAAGGNLHVISGTYVHWAGTSNRQPILLEDSALVLGGTTRAWYRWLGTGQLYGPVAGGTSIELRGSCTKPAALSAFDANGPVTGFTNEGTIDLVSANGCPGTARIEADVTNTGSLRVRAGKSGIGGALVNEGHVSIWPGASLGLDGTYTQRATGTLGIAIDSATSFGRFYPDEAAVGGTLEVIRPASFVPAVGTVFPIISVAGGVTGTWAAVHGAIISDGVFEDTYLRPEFSPGTASLAVRTASLDTPVPASGGRGGSVRVSAHNLPANAAAIVKLNGTVLANVITPDGELDTTVAVPLTATIGVQRLTVESPLTGVTHEPTMTR